MAELDTAAIQAELARLKHQVAAKTAAVEQSAAADATILASIQEDIEAIEAIEALLAGEPPPVDPPNGGEPTPEFDLILGPSPEGTMHSFELGQQVRGPGKLVLSVSGENPTALKLVGAVAGGLDMRLVTEATNGGNSMALFEADLGADDGVSVIEAVTNPAESLIGHVQWWPNVSGAPIKFVATKPDERRNTADGSLTLAGLPAGARVYTMVADNGDVSGVWAAHDMAEEMDNASTTSGGHGQAVWVRKGCPAGDWTTRAKRSAPAARIVAIAAEWAANDPVIPALPPPIEPPVEPVEPPPSGGEVGPIEPVDPGKPQVAIKVGTTPRQSWHGFGWGCGSHRHASRAMANLRANVRKLTEDMDAKVIRIFTPEATAACIAAYKPVWELVREHGVDTIFSSSYIYSHDHPQAASRPEGAADGIDAVLRAFGAVGTLAANLCNEPDTPERGNITAYNDTIFGHQARFRDRLNSLGRSRVITLGLEWRHPQTASRMQREFDMHDAAGRVGAGLALGGGLYHIYDKSANQDDYDSRFLRKGLPLWSTETGYLGDNAIARMMAGINHGSAVELAHIGQAATDDEKPVDQSQKLVAASGTPRPWYNSLKELSRELHRGTVMRLCLSSVAGRMLWKDWKTQHQAICGRRPDGRWIVAGNAFSAPAQMTVTIPELAQRNAVLRGRRIAGGGSVSTVQANMRDGVVRFSLAQRETIVLVG